MNENQKLAVLIPAYNEELIIQNTLLKLSRVISNEHVYLVDDGSKDDTFEIAQKYLENCISIENRGKAEALNFGIKHFDLIEKYDYVFFMDADTTPSENFIEEAIHTFQNDSSTDVVVGQVKSRDGGYISNYRMWEYELGHAIHKKAQSNLGNILVVPGCATVYKTSVFENVSVPSGTLTEDMDLTFLMHRMSIGKMVFNEKATVDTQDPKNLNELSKQISRWYTGFWQCARKHSIPWGGQSLDFEVALLGTEGLLNSLVVVTILALLPAVFISNTYEVYLIPFLLDFFCFFLPSLIWTSIRLKKPSVLYYFPHLYFLRIVSSFLFLKSFFTALKDGEKLYSWDTERYQVN